MTCLLRKPSPTGCQKACCNEYPSISFGELERQMMNGGMQGYTPGEIPHKVAEQERETNLARTKTDLLRFYQ